jgi:hypothetical protein
MGYFLYFSGRHCHGITNRKDELRDQNNLFPLPISFNTLNQQPQAKRDLTDERDGREIREKWVCEIPGQ